jgi:pilus assembly protein CpaB
MLALAVAFGLGAMIVAQLVLTSDRKQVDDVQDVLVAARDLKEEESLKPDMVKVVRMAKSTVPANAFSAFKDIDDRWVNMSMLEGDVLIEKKLGPKGSPPGLVNNIPKGMRAVSIDVTEQTGVSGFILPGHRVDVFKFESANRNEMHGETIIQDVLVLAANQLFSRTEERAVQSRTVTLAVSPDDVAVLVEARAKGPLSLALRGVNDHDVVPRTNRKSAAETELERRLKAQEERRLKLEQDLKLAQEQFARKVEPPPPKTPSPPRTHYLTIYRGIHNLQRIQTEFHSGQEPATIPEVAAIPEDSLNPRSTDRTKTKRLLASSDEE